MGGVGMNGADGVYPRPFGHFRNFMEQNIQAGTPYIRSLYYEPGPNSMVNPVTQSVTPISTYCEDAHGRSTTSDLQMRARGEGWDPVGNLKQ